MMRRLGILSIGAILLCVSALPALAQLAPAGAEKTFKLQVVISNYEGNKKLASEPYILTVTPGRNASLRSGAEIPIPSSSGYNMQQTGVSIDVNMKVISEGRYEVNVSITDRSVHDGQPAQQNGTLSNIARVPNVPAFRNISTASSVVMRAGETAEYLSTVDRASGQTMRVELTLTEVK